MSVAKDRNIENSPSSGITRGSAQGNILTKARRRVVLALALISAGATIVSLLFSAKLNGRTPAAIDSYGAGPLGHRLFAETLLELDYFVAQNRGANFTGTPNTLLFLEPRTQGRAGGFDQDLAPVLAERASEGLPTLVALPKWLLFPAQEDLPTLGPDSVGPGHVRDATLPDAHIHISRGSASRTLHGTLGTFVVEVPTLQVFRSVGRYDEVLLDAAEGAVVVRSAAGIVVVSDPDLFHNYNFHRAEHPDLMMAILQRGFPSTSDTIVFDEVFHGHGMKFSLGEAMGEFPAVLLVVHLVFVLLILFAMGTRRFGPPTRRETLGHGPTETIEVSASVLADGQSAGSIVFQYVCEVLQDTHLSLGLPPKHHLADMAAALDEAQRRRGGEAAARRLYEEAVAVRHDKKATPDLWRIVRSVHALRDELLARRRGARPSPRQEPPRQEPPHQGQNPEHAA